VLGSSACAAAALGARLVAPSAPASVEPVPELLDPPAHTEVFPVPRYLMDTTRTGRGLLAAGGVLLGFGAVGRLAIEGFWAGPARLEAREPFGQWSIPNIAFFTTFANVLVVPGLVVTGFGARRHGAWRVASGARTDDPARTRRNARLGWGLLGGGLSLWAVTRAVALPVLRGCETNGCAYGYLESTYWLSLGAAVSGIALWGLTAGERRAARRFATVPTLAPTLAPGWRGLSLGGRF
jgi:hypothetical protein